jgi:hypothetical protein
MPKSLHRRKVESPRKSKVNRNESRLFDPSPEEQVVKLIDAAVLRQAERLIESCEGCNPEGAEIPFDNILDRVTASDPSVTDYILEQPAKCQIVGMLSLKKH